MISSQQVRDIFAKLERLDALEKRLAKLEAAVLPKIDPQFAQMEDEEIETASEAKGGKPKKRRAA